MYDLVIENGVLIDPSQGLHEKKDIAIEDGKVAVIESKIVSGQSERIIDASGMIVTPGLIDLHTHVAFGFGSISVDPKTACLSRGCTTVVDAGSTGEILFRGFKRYVIEPNDTRIYALLNIESLGMIEMTDDPPSFTDQKWPQLITCLDELMTPLFINVENTVEAINEYRDTVLGIKWAHHGLRALELARDAADKAKCLLMAENRYLPETLRFLRKGDILTHLFLVKDKSRHVGGLLDEDLKVQPEILEATKRGVLLDVGHGKSSFSWKIAEQAIEQGIRPDTISTDLWIGNINGPVHDLPTTMTKFLLLGMSLDEIVRASTTKPAEILGKSNTIGILKTGTCADMAIFRIQNGKFPLVDSYGEQRLGRQRLVPISVIRNGIEHSIL